MTQRLAAVSKGYAKQLRISVNAAGTFSYSVADGDVINAVPVQVTPVYSGASYVFTVNAAGTAVTYSSASTITETLCGGISLEGASYDTSYPIVINTQTGAVTCSSSSTTLASLFP